MGGTVTLSIEVELGWGVHDLGAYDHLSADGRKERTYAKRLLDRCDEMGIPISFDVVGHLLLDECDGHHDGPYPAGWFAEDPGTGPETDGLFYAPDIVDAIATSRTPHEICTHTFSHTLATGPNETVVADLERAQQVHERHLGERTASLVPPRHVPPSRSVLADAGIEIVRPGRDTSEKSRARRFRELVAGPVPTWEPQLVDGIVETYCTTYPSLTAPSLFVGQRAESHPVYRFMPVALRRRLYLRALSESVQRVAETDGDLHLWCHLFDICNEQQWPLVSEFLGYLSERQAAGDVDVLTMAELNDRVREQPIEAYPSR